MEKASFSLKSEKDSLHFYSICGEVEIFDRKQSWKMSENVHLSPAVGLGRTVG